MVSKWVVASVCLMKYRGNMKLWILLERVTLVNQESFPFTCSQIRLWTSQVAQ